MSCFFFFYVLSIMIKKTLIWYLPVHRRPLLGRRLQSNANNVLINFFICLCEPNINDASFMEEKMILVLTLFLNEKGYNLEKKCLTMVFLFFFLKCTVNHVLKKHHQTTFVVYC